LPKIIREQIRLGEEVMLTQIPARAGRVCAWHFLDLQDGEFGDEPEVRGGRIVGPIRAEHFAGAD